MTNPLFFILLMGIISSCHAPEPAEKATADSPTKHSLTGFDILPELQSADSVQCLYFKDPYGKDSLRYTRFFTYYNTHDTTLINPILRNINQPFILRHEIMQSHSTGKLFFFQQKQALKTLYFNTDSSAGSSPYLYFIKDGNFYYFTLHPSLKTLLDATKKRTKEVESQVTD